MNEEELWLSDEKWAKFAVQHIHQGFELDHESVATIHSVLLTVREDDDDGRIAKLMLRIRCKVLDDLFKSFRILVFFDDDFVSEVLEEPTGWKEQ